MSSGIFCPAGPCPLPRGLASPGPFRPVSLREGRRSGLIKALPLSLGRDLGGRLLWVFEASIVRPPWTASPLAPASPPPGHTPARPHGSGWGLWFSCNKEEKGTVCISVPVKCEKVGKKMKNTARQRVSGTSKREHVCAGVDNATLVHWASPVRLPRAPSAHAWRLCVCPGLRAGRPQGACGLTAQAGSTPHAERQAL